jgi:uncharacterized membrane protein YccC
MQDRSIQAALGQGIGTIITAAVVAHLKFFLLVNRETFLGLALVIAIGLVPLGALSSLPLYAPYFIPASLNFVPMLSPTNLMTYDVVAYMNTALGLLAGCAAGGFALLLIPLPAAPVAATVDLTIEIEASGLASATGPENGKPYLCTPDRDAGNAEPVQRRSSRRFLSEYSHSSEPPCQDGEITEGLPG